MPPGANFGAAFPAGGSFSTALKDGAIDMGDLVFIAAPAERMAEEILRGMDSASMQPPYDETKASALRPTHSAAAGTEAAAT